MYNRYIPSADGYVRHTVHPLSPAPSCPEPEAPSAPPPQSCRTQKRSGILQRLLPQKWDLDDILIVLILVLLLLDSSDEEDSLTALLAVAAFLLLQ